MLGIPLSQKGRVHINKYIPTYFYGSRCSGPVKLGKAELVEDKKNASSAMVIEVNRFSSVWAEWQFHSVFLLQKLVYVPFHRT